MEGNRRTQGPVQNTQLILGRTVGLIKIAGFFNGNRGRERGASAPNQSSEAQGAEAEKIDKELASPSRFRADQNYLTRERKGTWRGEVPRRKLDDLPKGKRNPKSYKNQIYAEVPWLTKEKTQES